jgi:hypothetical protein
LKSVVQADVGECGSQLTELFTLRFDALSGV